NSAQEVNDASVGIVIGQQLADAIAAEERRKVKGNLGKSPMPKGAYDREDELGLLRPRLAPFDTALAKLTQKFAKGDEHARAATRSSISMEELYTLLAFSKR